MTTKHDNSVIVTRKSCANEGSSETPTNCRKQLSNRDLNGRLTGVGWLMAIGCVAFTAFSPGILEPWLVEQPLDKFMIDLMFWNKDNSGIPAYVFCGFISLVLFVASIPILGALGHPMFQD